MLLEWFETNVFPTMITGLLGGILAAAWSSLKAFNSMKNTIANAVSLGERLEKQVEEIRVDLKENNKNLQESISTTKSDLVVAQHDIKILQGQVARLENINDNRKGIA